MVTGQVPKQGVRKMKVKMDAEKAFDCEKKEEMNKWLQFPLGVASPCLVGGGIRVLPRV